MVIVEYLTQFDILAKIQNLPNIPVSQYEQTAIFFNELTVRDRVTDLCIKKPAGRKNKVKGTEYSRIQAYKPYNVLPCAPLRYVETDSCMELSQMPVITGEFSDAVILHLGVKLKWTSSYRDPLSIRARLDWMFNSVFLSAAPSQARLQLVLWSLKNGLRTYMGNTLIFPCLFLSLTLILKYLLNFVPKFTG